MSSSPSILNLVAKSPFLPLQEHMHQSRECAEHLTLFFQAAISEDWEKAETALNAITDAEKKADDLKRDLRRLLHKGLFLPVSRADILALLSMQDKIANTSRDIAGVVFGRRMLFPQGCAAKLTPFVAKSLEAIGQAEKVVDEASQCFKKGFGRNVSELAETAIEELDHVEHETDIMQIELREVLFAIEKELPAVEVIFLYRVMEQIGQLADHAQKVGARCLLMLAR